MKLAHKLKHRISIQEAAQTPNDEGGFDRSYTTLTTIWAGMDNVSDYIRNLIYIRGENDSDQKTPAHKFVVRWAAVRNLGKEFDRAFGIDFNSIADLMPLKSDMFIFLHQGSAYKGRRFQVLDISRDENNKEWIKFRTAEMEETGTGYPE